MPWSVFIHVSACLAAGADPKGAVEHVRACLKDEGLDDPRDVQLHQGVDGAPRIVWGSERLVGLTGDEDKFAARLAASLDGELTVGARVSLGDPDAYEAAVMHAVRSEHLGGVESARRAMTAERAAALVGFWEGFETWEQRGALVQALAEHPVDASAPLWRELLVGPAETPRSSTCLRAGMVISLRGLTRLAGGPPFKINTDNDLLRAFLDRARAHLRAGGALPLPEPMFRPVLNPADLDAYAQLAGPRGAAVSKLLASVFQAPREDAPRLALAKAIRAKHPERARAIELGIEIAGYHRRGQATPVELGREIDALIAAHGRDWAGPVARLAHRVVLRRGFVEDLTVDVDRLYELTAFGTGPLCRSPGRPERGYLETCGLLDLEVHGAHGKIAQLGTPRLSGLRSLRLPAQGLTDDDAEALAACTSLRELRGLDLRANQIGWRGFQAIAAGLRSLRWVELGANGFDDPCGDDAPPEVRAAAVSVVGRLPWLVDPLRRADGDAPFVEQLDVAG